MPIPLVVTPWQTKIAMEMTFIGKYISEPKSNGSFPIAMLVYRRAVVFSPIMMNRDDSDFADYTIAAYVQHNSYS